MIRRARRGFSLIEFIIATTLIVALLAAASLTLATVQRSFAEIRARDDATQVAYELIEQLRLFGCGSAVDTQSQSAITQVCTTAFAARGWSVTDGDYAGDFSMQRTISGRSITARVQTLFRQSRVPDSTCYSTTATTDNDTSSVLRTELVQPALARRVVTLEWTLPAEPEGQRTRTLSLSATHGVPTGNSWARTSRGGLVTTGPAGTKVTLTNGTGFTLSRVIPTGSCNGVWFPYLVPGTYTVNGVSVSITSGVVASRAVV